MAHHKMITEDHVRAALIRDKGDSAELSSWKIEDFTKAGDNYATVATSVNIVYRRQGQNDQVSYVVKANTEDSGEYKDFIRTLYLKEVEFLGEIAPALSLELTAVGQEALRFPRLIHSCSTDGQGLIFLEDLRTRGFKMYGKLKGLDVPHTNLVLKELARLHAASLLLQAKYPNEDPVDKYPWLKYNWHNNSEKAEEIFNAEFGSYFEGALTKLSTFGGFEAAEKWMDTHKDKCVEVFKKHIARESPFDVIIHGDCWNNNFLFRYNDTGVPVEVTLIDFQLCHKGSPARDLTYLMFSSFTGDVRKANTEAFLQTYYETLHDVMREGNAPVPFTYDQLLEEYRNKLEYGLLFSTLFVNVMADSMDISQASEKKINELVKGWNELSLKKMSDDPFLRARFCSVYEELTEKGVFDS